MRQLIDMLNKASDAYYNTGNTIMSDKEFDSKLKELEMLEKETGTIISNSPTQRVGSPVLTKLKKVTHEHKSMLSLEKVHSAEEIIKFANGKEVIAMIKLDGLSVRLTYQDGELIKAETRGNGVEGSLITDHVRQFKNVPLFIDKKGTYVVDGEAIITDKDFESINAALPKGTEKFKNSRNLASGTLALLDTSLVKERHLRFILWDVIAGDDSEYFIGKLNKAKELGFEITHLTGCELKKESVDVVNETILNLAKEDGFPCDGVVWKFNDIAYGESLGQTSHHFCNAVAWKKQNEEYETILTDVEWDTSKTGLINPVAIFQPVEIEGSTITKSTLHNLSYMKDMNIAIGETITVIKSNEVIPKVTSCIADHWDFNIPAGCPVCGGRTEIRKDNDTEVLVCTNDNCQGKLLGKLCHAASKNALNIEGMSEATLQLLINRNWVKSLKDVYNFNENHIMLWKHHTVGFGEKSVQKLLNAIEKSRNTTLERIIYAQSINLIGRTASKDISSHCQNDIEAFCGLMNEGYDFTIIDGFGREMQKSLMNWWKNNRDEFLDLLKEFTFESTYEIVSDNRLEGLTFVITGSLNHFTNRDALSEKIVSLGGKVSGSVSAKTSYLINNDINSSTGKNAKAKSLGIEIIDENNFLRMIGE